jgi:hypothetical protein
MRLGSHLIEGNPNKAALLLQYYFYRKTFFTTWQTGSCGIESLRVRRMGICDSGIIFNQPLIVSAACSAMATASSRMAFPSGRFSCPSAQASDPGAPENGA